LARRFGGGTAGAGGTTSGNGGNGNGGSGNGGSGNGGGNGGSGNGGSGNGGSGNGGGTTGRGPGGPSGGGSVGPLPGETAIGPEPGPEQDGFDPFGGLLSGIFGGPTIPAAAAEPDLPSNTITQTNQSATFNVTDPADVTETTYTLNKQKTVDAALANAIQESMIAYPEAWAESTGTTNVQQQFENVTGIKFPTIFTAGTNGAAPDDPDYIVEQNGFTVEGADVPGVDYFASALEFFENLLGGKKEELDTVDEKDLPIEPTINAGDLVGPGPNPGPGPDALEVLYDPDRCTRIARTLLADTNVSSDFKNKAKWYLGSNLQCDTFFNDVSYAANLNQITGLTQRQIQLEALGLASEDISRSLAEEANVREAQRLADVDYITEVNTRLSNDVSNLGDAALSLQQQIADLGNAEKGCAWFDIPCQIGEAGRSAAIPVLVIGGGILAAWLLLKRRR